MGIRIKFKIYISLDLPSIPLSREGYRLLIPSMMQTNLIEKINGQLLIDADYISKFLQ